ncbi:hypothetical protein C1701_15775 [Actinoalloteichus sp. AHMU CJ021]|nr:hypothetical protein C1701_15775 [Actinoalloteichus sp. AHMU CJ021]
MAWAGTRCEDVRAGPPVLPSTGARAARCRPRSGRPPAPAAAVAETGTGGRHRRGGGDHLLRPAVPSTVASRDTGSTPRTARSGRRRPAT